MNDSLIDRISEELEQGKESVSKAYNMKKYIDGERSAGELLEASDGRLVLAGGFDVVPLEGKGWGYILQTVTEMQGAAAISTLRKGYRQVGVEDSEMAQKVFSIKDLGYMFQMWLDLGYLDIEQMKVEKRDGTENDIELVELGEELSSGEVKEITVIAKDGFTVRAAEEAGFKPDYPLCVLGPGYAAGSFETWLNHSCEFTEERCQATGHETCKWVFEFS